MKKFVLAAVAVALSSGSAYAATADGSATATVVAPLTLSHDTNAKINFGLIDPGTGGTVLVTAAGAGSPSGGVTLVSGSTNTADSFTVGGAATRGFTILAGPGSVTSGANSMTFTTTPSATSATLSAGGTATFTVGGTLTVAAAQASGSYTGSYTATVAYN